MLERKTIGAFEGARGVAALLVAIYHFALLFSFALPYPVVVRNGYLFVDLFFVLSGYVICASYESRLVTVNDLWTFAIRRFGRLFPLLIASTIAFVLVPNLYELAKHAAVMLGHANLFHDPHPVPHMVPSLAEIVATLTMTHGLGMFDKAILNFVSWSISTEFYTYMLFALACLFVAGRARIMLFATVSAVAFAVTCWASLTLHDCVATRDCLNITYDFGLTRCLTSFSLGCLTFYTARRLRPHGNALQIGALLAVYGVFAATDRVPVMAFACPLVFAVLILSLSSDRGYVARALNTAPAQLLGRCSYSIYLMHPVLIKGFGFATRHLTGTATGFATLLVYTVTLLLISGLTYRYIEAPFRDQFNRWARQQRVASGVTETA
ncbi:acyltransferase [Paraburkholderia sp. J67]|uniref:acyltransferase family protein n=1 Tax=Paraburkholderia sp. J67 TaxID=2805435 RepID=UPI002ABD631C|nr:acyltransferase [Paraburkholderia sp. J67]